MNQFGARLEALHEDKLVGVDAGRRERRRRLRPLDRQEDAVERLDGGVEILGQRTQMRLVGGGVAGVGHDHEALVAEPGDDQVVDDAGRLR